MPNARTHDAITIVTGLALAPLTYGTSLAQGHLPATAGVDTLLLVGSHLLSGIMFSPDLDIDSAIDNRWGIFYWIWRPYMWLTPHRRWFSHGLIFPPLLRLLYFWVMLTICFTVVAWLLAQVGVIVPDYPPILAAISWLLAIPIHAKPGSVSSVLLPAVPRTPLPIGSLPVVKIFYVPLVCACPRTAAEIATNIITHSCP